MSPNAPEQTVETAENRSKVLHGYSEQRLSDLFDRVTRLETQRESDLERAKTFEKDVRANLSDIEAKLDALLTTASQRKGVEKIFAFFWDSVKLVAAAIAGALMSKYTGH